jgi:hypothetical protein
MVYGTLPLLITPHHSSYRGCAYYLILSNQHFSHPQFDSSRFTLVRSPEDAYSLRVTRRNVFPALRNPRRTAPAICNIAQADAQSVSDGDHPTQLTAL